jgi:hypothetical protein
MKTLRILFVFNALLFSEHIQGQLIFSLSSSLCVGANATVTANTGSLTALQYSWGVLPSGPVFSTPTASSTSITFPTAGIFTIALGVLTGSGFVYSTNTIVINALPTLTYASTSNNVCAGFTSTLTAFGANSYTWISSTSSIAIVQQSISVGPGNFTIIASNGGSCTNTLSPVLIGLLTPSLAMPINIVSSSPTTCIYSNFPKFSKPVNLKASGAATYIWFPNNSSFPSPTLDVRPTSTTCYTVIGSSATCSATAVSCVTVIPQFTMNIAPASLTICKGESHVLQVGNVEGSAVGPLSAWTYSWSESLNATPISISSFFTPSVNVFPLNSASYTLEIRDSRGCLSLPAQVPVTVDLCAGITIESLGDLLKSYPNPVKSHLKLYTDLSGEFVISFIDVFGKKFLQETIDMHANKETSIDLSNIPSGVYFLKVFQEGNQVQSRKIIKE